MTGVTVEERVYSVAVDGDAVTVVVDSGAVRVVEVGTPGPQGPAGATSSVLVAGEALSALRVVKADAATGKAVYASTAALSDSGLAVGVTLASAAVGAAVTVQTQGLLTDANWAWDVTGGSDRRLYLGAAGQLVQGPPGGGAVFVQPVGVVVGATSIVVRIGASVLG